MSDSSERLERSRLAIIEQVQRKQEHKHRGFSWRRRADEREGEPEDEAPFTRAQARAQSGEGLYRRQAAHGGGWFGHLKRALGAWWRHHPAHLGVELATPMLSSYAGRQPAVYLGAASLLGAVIVVTRPWRLISVTGLVVALVKTSQLSSMVMSAMSAADFERDHRRPG